MSRPVIVASLLALLAFHGCAPTKVTDREKYEGRRLPRPGRILVHDFAVTATDLPKWSEAWDRVATPSKPRTAEEIEVGRRLGSQVANELVADIREMGLPAVRAAGQPGSDLGDIAIVGYFTSNDEGSADKRVVIGFGAGAAELETQVEGYLATDSGMRRLSSRTFDSSGGEGTGHVGPMTLVTANPIGFVVGGAAKAIGELSGGPTLEGIAKRTADTIAGELRKAFKRQEWI